MKRLTYLLMALILLGILSNRAIAATDEQLGNKAEANEKKEKAENKEKTEPPNKDTEKSDKEKENDEKYTVHKTGEGHGGVPTSGGYKP